MVNKINFEKALKKLLNDKTICKKNRDIFKEFFDDEREKLESLNDLDELDNASYKTMYCYIGRFRNVNKWFNNKPLNKITKEDFEKFHIDFRKNNILTTKGQPFKDKGSYYNKVFKNGLFKMMGKDKIVREVTKNYVLRNKGEVRYIEEDEVKQLIEVIVSPKHKLLTWLAFDIGENVNALLKLRKKDFVKQIDKDTNVPEYRVNLREEILKRSRRERNILTNFEETVKLLDLVLDGLKADDNVFDFKYRNAKKFFDRAVRITKMKCKPNGETVTFKDLRSSMACNLLNKDWSRDEINSRLGHVPSSSEIDKYINFFAIDGKKPQRKVYEHNLGKIQGELEKTQEREKLYKQRLENQQEKLESYEKEQKDIRSQLKQLKELEKVMKKNNEKIMKKIKQLE